MKTKLFIPVIVAYLLSPTLLFAQMNGKQIDNILFEYIPNPISTNIIDSIKIIPSNPFVSDSIFFATFSDQFGGDCSYELAVDSIVDTRIFISGKFDGMLKCIGWTANRNRTFDLY